MKLLLSCVACLFVAVAMLPGQTEKPAPAREESLTPEQFNKAHKSLYTPEKSRQAGALTERLVSGREAPTGPPASTVERRTFIDEFIFSKMEQAGVPHAPTASDGEFLRRATLDLTGRIPTPDEVRAFRADSDPDKRDKLIDSLIATEAWVDKWSYVFLDLFRANGKMGRGQYLFHYWLKENLRSDRPYDETVRDIITPSAKSNWVVAAANVIAREHVQGAAEPLDGDDLSMVQQLDTHDELAIIYGKAFLGLNLSCISCHDGQGHLEKVNVWLSQRTREQFFRNASFLGRTRYLMYWENGRTLSNEFLIDDRAAGYDTQGATMLRVARKGGSNEPAFLVSGEGPQPDEAPRDAFARLLTANPQFARATVNMFWAKLMGVGIVEPYDEFDLARQDPDNLPEGWRLQPSHPELLDALAADFVENGYSLKRLMATITKSSAYQLSAAFPGDWKDSYTKYYARKYARRLTAEELHDSIVLATDRPASFQQKGRRVGMSMRLTDPPARCTGKNCTDADTRHFMRIFGQSDRQTHAKPTGASIQHSLVLMQSPVVNDRVRAEKDSRVERLLASYPDDDGRVVDEMFLASLARAPSDGEKDVALAAMETNRVAGAENLQWALINSAEFFFNY